MSSTPAASAASLASSTPTPSASNVASNSTGLFPNPPTAAGAQQSDDSTSNGADQASKKRKHRVSFPPASPAPSSSSSSSAPSASSSSLDWSACSIVPPPAGAPPAFMCAKIDWIDHQSAPIYSCDIHPASTRLVTAGGDNTLRVWALPPLLSAAAECQPLSAAPRLLASLPNHLNPVNCCRFSPSGALLASCSDGVNGSAAVLLWRLAAAGDEYESSRPFGSERDEGEDVEHWQLVAQLRGHTADILDLAFSPDGRHLASASVDNNVVLWDCQHYAAVAVLRGHAGWVKGVSWDPCGRYVASYGDDQCVMLWDGRDEWKCKRRITDTFAATAADKEGGGGGKGIGRIGINEKMKQIVFARLSWSADGAYLAASRGYDGSKAIPVSPMFNRAGWKRTSVLVGHKHPTTVTRFNPRMFTRAAAPVAADSTATLHGALNGSAVKRRSARSHLSTQSLDAESSQPPFYPTYTVCAVGSLDNSISVWVTSSPTPLVHLDAFFAEAVVDLSWSGDGYTLLACSHDGSVAVFTFTEDEFGRALTGDEMRAHMRHEYGGEEAAGVGGGAAAVESLVGLELEAMGREYAQRREKAEEESRSNGVARASSTAKLTSEELKASQKEGTKVDSKGRVRRVVAPVHIETSTVYSSSLPPVLLLPPADAAVQTGATQSAAAASNHSSISSTLSAPATFAASSSPSLSTAAPSSFSTSAPSSDLSAAKRKRDIDGVQLQTKKKRTAIIATSAASTAPVATSSSPAPTSVPSSSVPQSSAASSASASPASSPPVAPSHVAPRPRYCVEPAPLHKHLLCRLPPASDELFSAASLSSGAADISMLESIPPVSAPRGLASSSPRPFSTLVCRRAGAEQWQTVLPGHCTLLAASASTIVACCRDERDGDSTGSLFFLSRSGRRLLPPLHLSAPASFLAVCTAATTLPSSSDVSPALSSAFVLLLTSDGQLRLFNSAQLECVLELDVRSLLSSSPFSAARVLSDGRLLLVVKDGTCWLYERRLKGWLNLADTDYVASDFKSTLPLASIGGAAQNGADRSLSSLQSEAQTASSAGAVQVRAPLLTLDARTRSMHTVAHIEAQLAASEQLGSSSDYQRWLHVYAQTLVALSQANDTTLDFTAANPVSSPLATLALARLHELTSALLPPLHSFQPDGERVCGQDRCATLRSLLPALASGRQTQRIAESVLKRVKEWEQWKLAQRLTESTTARKQADVNEGDDLPSLFSSVGSVRSPADTNGFHPSLSQSSTVTDWSSSPSTPTNGLNGSSVVSKHQQLEQRLKGSALQSPHATLNGKHAEHVNGNAQSVMVD